MQGEKEKKVSNSSRRSTKKKEVRFLLGERVLYPRSGGEKSTYVNHGDSRPRSACHKEVESSNMTKVDDSDDGPRKEKKRERNSDRGDSRPRSACHKEVESSNMTKVDGNGDGPRKEKKREHNSDRGDSRPRFACQKEVESSNMTKVDKNDDGPRKEKKREHNSDRGDSRPRFARHKEEVESSNMTKVDNNGDGRPKTKKREHSSDRGNKRPRSACHKQKVGSSDVTEADDNDDEKPRKEMIREQNSDRGAGHHGDRILASSSSEQMYPPNCPALKRTWMGCFEVIGNKPEEDMHCDMFLAHPPMKLSLKAYEFSRKFPEIMQFRLLPRCKVWPELFEMAWPNSLDIALYFYPEQSERSKKMYERLLKNLEANDMALRTRIGSVELLVFASKLLPMDSQRLNRSYFMWGVFRSLKDKDS